MITHVVLLVFVPFLNLTFFHKQRPRWSPSSGTTGFQPGVSEDTWPLALAASAKAHARHECPSDIRTVTQLELELPKV